MTTVRIYTEGLLSKWGFGDGDTLDDLLCDHGFGDVWKSEHDLGGDHFHFDHRVLMRVVEGFIIPAVSEHHKIEVCKIHTIHNPIRAKVVDGEKVCTTGEPVFTLSPEWVDVPLADILVIAREEAGA